MDFPISVARRDGIRRKNFVGYIRLNAHWTELFVSYAYRRRGMSVKKEMEHATYDEKTIKSL